MKNGCIVAIFHTEMRNSMDNIKKYWHWFFIGSIFVFEAIVLFILRENIYVGICDNLDLFITQLKMLHDGDTFFAHDKIMPILGGIDRDYFPTELSLYNILYLIMPDIYAYIAGYLIKIVMAVFSSVLLAKYVLKDSYKKYEKIVVIVAMAFALLPLYPMYAICFASMPLVLYLLIRLYKELKIWMYIALFLYPLVSYFTFFGAFILGYILIATFILSIKVKKIPWRMLVGFLVLFAGYFCFEYRLFGIMFFSDTETIRSTMLVQSYGIKELWNTFVDVFVSGFSHAQSAHTYFVLPVCILFFVWINFTYIKRKEYKKIITDKFNLTMLFIVFNCIVYALYYWEPLRKMIETILPPLKGFQYGRTIFFNAFAWYFALFIVLKRIYDSKKNIAYILGIIAICVVGATQCEYSDFYNTVYCNLYKVLKNAEPNQLSYGEFFAKELFDDIKEDINYTPDIKACAYAMHPAVLSYNGISTVDGYCGYYSQEYKETFRNVIEPVLDEHGNWQSYYDDWACRAYIFPASGENLYDFGANAQSEPQEIRISEKALNELECKYIFSRVEIVNASSQKLEFIKYYENENIPYGIYLYEIK